MRKRPIFTVRFKVREMAEAKGYENAGQLSRDADIGPSTAYGYWSGDRTGKVDYITLWKIARVLGVYPDDLIKVDETTEDTPPKPPLPAAA